MHNDSSRQLELCCRQHSCDYIHRWSPWTYVFITFLYFLCLFSCEIKTDSPSVCTCRVGMKGLIVITTNAWNSVGRYHRINCMFSSQCLHHHTTCWRMYLLITCFLFSLWSSRSAWWQEAAWTALLKTSHLFCFRHFPDASDFTARTASWPVAAFLKGIEDDVSADFSFFVMMRWIFLGIMVVTSSWSPLKSWWETG